MFSLKVCINPRLINGGCTSGEDNSKDEDEDDEDEDDDVDDDDVDNNEGYSFPPKATRNIIKKSSCSSILRQNR